MTPRANIKRGAAAAGAALLCGCAVFAPVSAVADLIVDFEEAPAPGMAAGTPGASLKTDSETDDLLARADQFAKQGRYDLASTLWQTVIDSSNDLVFTRDEWMEETLEHTYQRYRSVTGDIEGTLAKLPDEGLEGYRIKADGEAKRVLARPGDDGREAALAEVVRRYFLSSIGDDAAFELACRKLDRYEFLPAIRLLAKIADEYPAPSVERDEVLLRMAALNGRVGDPQRALELVEELRSRETPTVPAEVLALVEQDIEKAGLRGAGGQVDGDALWPMAMGGPQRLGLMPTPATVPGADSGAAAEWAQPWDLVVPEGWPDLKRSREPVVDLDNAFGVAVRGSSRKPKKPSTPESRLKDWPLHGWYPSARALFAAGRVYFKNADRLVCADAATGELKWLGFRNEYPFPPVFTRARAYRSGDDDSVGRAPIDGGEVQAFGDSVHQSMCLVRDKVLTIQGKPMDFTEESIPVAAAAPPVGVIMRASTGSQAARFRTNRLVAYHARNGKLQWMRQAVEPEEGAAPKQACFAGPPVPYAGLVLVPVLEERGMFLTAIDTEGGATLWRTFLGDEPEATAPGSAITIAVDGGEAYVATGAGLVFSVDAISGAMNWAVRYERTLVDGADAGNNRNRFRNGYAKVARFDGWAEEMIIPSGNTVVVTPADFDHVVAFDRRSGSLLWESAREPGEGSEAADYALGVRDGKFYVAGNGVLRCYRVGGGRMLWELEFEPGHGRGALVADAIYVPSGEDKVLRIVETTTESGIVSGEVESEFSVTVEAPAGEDDAEADEGEDDGPLQPVGNLYSDGERLYGLGLQRVYAIKELDPDEVFARAADRERRAAEKRAAEEKAMADAGAKLGTLAGIADELDAAMAAFPASLRKALEGDKGALDLTVARVEKAAAALEKMPDPDAEVIAVHRKRFASRAEQIGEEMGEVMLEFGGDDGLDELMEEFSERMEASDATLERFGFSESHGEYEAIPEGE